MLKNYLQQVITLCRRSYNKYLLVGLLFSAWMVFSDKHSVIEKMQIKNKINRLEKEKDYYRKKIDDDKRKIDELLSSPDKLEKFAREQYLMKNKDEDIFIIIDK